MGESGSNPWSINSPRLTLLLVLKQNILAISILNLESSPLQYCNPHLRSPNHKSTLYHILA